MAMRHHMNMKPGTYLAVNQYQNKRYKLDALRTDRQVKDWFQSDWYHMVMKHHRNMKPGIYLAVNQYQNKPV